MTKKVSDHEAFKRLYSDFTAVLAMKPQTRTLDKALDEVEEQLADAMMQLATDEYLAECGLRELETQQVIDEMAAEVNS